MGARGQQQWVLLQLPGVHWQSGRHSGDGPGSTSCERSDERSKGKYHHVYFDNIFPSVSLLADLDKEGIYSCGTARKDRRGFPMALKKPSLLTYRYVTMGLCIYVTLDNTHM